MLAAANVRLAPTSLFDPAAILGYLRGKAAEAGTRIKSAISKVLGIYDAAESLIHIDDASVKSKSKKTFLTLHETAHHDLPVHRRMFRFFQDCEQTLAPEIADQFEREANNFARFALFKGDTYARYAADCTFEIKTPIKLAKKFGASNYASAREFARTHHRACVVYILEPIEFVNGHGARAAVRRIEPSPSFRDAIRQAHGNLHHARPCARPRPADWTQNDPTANALIDGPERRPARMRRRGFRHDAQHHYPSLSCEGTREADDHSAAGLQESRIDAPRIRGASSAAIVFRIAPRRLVSLTDAHSAPARARLKSVARLPASRSTSNDAERD